MPFCAGKCDYCDFYSVPVNQPELRYEGSLLERFVKTLLFEGRRLFETYKPGKIPSLYIGGGTPSVLGPAGIRHLLEGLLQLITGFSSPPVEITVELNPESVDEVFLAEISEAGVTRLSLGIQSFYGPSRQAVSRIGDEAHLDKSLSLAAQYFPAAFSVDLISGLPLQNENILLDDINAVTGYKPSHISLYALTMKENTLLANLPDGDEADRLWILGRDALEKSGYSQYEVSNFCQGGRESLHNVRYWRLQNWLALGPAASATIINDETGTGLRYTYPPDVNEWLSPLLSPLRPPLTEELDTITLVKETLLMGFRYTGGPDEDLFLRRFHRCITDCIPETLKAWRGRGLLQKDKPALTKEGLLLLNRFLIEAFEELE